jgi:hypothetical protein
VEKGSLTDQGLALVYQDTVADIFPTETAFLHMRALRQQEIRHLMTRKGHKGVLILEDRPCPDGPEGLRRPVKALNRRDDRFVRTSGPSPEAGIPARRPLASRGAIPHLVRRHA